MILTRFWGSEKGGQPITGVGLYTVILGKLTLTQSMNSKK